MSFSVRYREQNDWFCLFDLSRSPKVKGHSIKWKPIYDFLYVCNTNQVCISHSFWDICQKHDFASLPLLFFVYDLIIISGYVSERSAYMYVSCCWAKLTKFWVDNSCHNTITRAIEVLRGSLLTFNNGITGMNSLFNAKHNINFYFHNIF